MELMARRGSEALITMDAFYEAQGDRTIHRAILGVIAVLNASIDRRRNAESTWADHMKDMNRLTFLARNLSPENLKRLTPEINALALFFQLTTEGPPVKS